MSPEKIEKGFNEWWLRNHKVSIELSSQHKGTWEAACEWMGREMEKEIIKDLQEFAKYSYAPTLRVMAKELIKKYQKDKEKGR